MFPTLSRDRKETVHEEPELTVLSKCRCVPIYRGQQGRVLDGIHIGKIGVNDSLAPPSWQWPL